MAITSFQDLAEAVQKNDVKSTVAVVCAHDDHTLESIVRATTEGLVAPILIGKEAEIRTILEKLGADPAAYRTVDEDTVEGCLAAAVALVKSGEADILMKGKLETGDYMRAILNRDNDLRKGSLLSVVGLFETKAYHKLLAVSDMAVNTNPDLDGKRAIVENAVDLLHSIGIAEPKVALLAAVEKVNPKMPETVDADAIKQLNVAGELTGCIVDGPLSFDIATSKEAAEIKGYDSPVAGDADLLVVPEIVSGNILAKCLTGFAGAITAGTVVGAKVPVVLTPRSAEASDKFYSIALAAYAAQNL